MAYSIEWKPGGAIKRFSGTVTFSDVLASEEEISGSPHFNALRYVISDYTGAEYAGITASQRADVNALRIGGFLVNKNIKYILVVIEFPDDVFGFKNRIYRIFKPSEV